MIDKPKLAATLELLDLPGIEDALAIEGGLLEAVDWSGQEAKRVTIDGVVFKDANLTGTKLRDGGWMDVSFESGLLAGLNVAGSSLRRINIKSARGDGMVLSETDLRDVSFRSCKLDLSNARYAKWQRVEFITCSLRDVDFNGAMLEHVTFVDCDLTGSDFSGAKLKNVDLRRAAFDNLKGLHGLEGAIMSYQQTMSMAPQLATELGIIVKDE